MRPSNMITKFVEWDGQAFNTIRVAPVKYKRDIKDSCALRAHLIVKALQSIVMCFIIAMVVASIINFIGYSIYGLAMFGINPAETLEMLIKADAGSVLGIVANFISVVFALVVVCLSIMTILVSLVFGLMILLRPLFIRTNFSEFYQSYKQKYCQKVEWK